MKKLTILLLSALIAISSCTSKKAATTEKSPADIVAEVKKNYSEAQLAEGKTLWQDNCKKCHKLHDGPDYTVKKWENVLPRMFNRAKVNDEQSGKIRAYLLANAKI
jgi:cytochrome c5